ncbi:MAG: COQ9 family protein [Paracoccaceae bacterium]
MPDSPSIETRLLEAALPHVAFDGWSEATLAAAARDSEIDIALARAVFPRGGLDMALAYHRSGDRAMLAGYAARDLSNMRYRDKVTALVRLRVELADKEAVQRGAALLALPQNALAGAGAMWGTADAIWTALGDTSRDGNWYSKRAILSAVLSSTVLYWLGDDSADHAETWAFLDRRIEDVMRFETAKAQARKSPLLAGPLALFERLRAPEACDGLPGRVRG